MSARTKLYEKQGKGSIRKSSGIETDLAWIGVCAYKLTEALYDLEKPKGK